MRIFHKMSVHQYIHETIHDKKFAKIIDEWSVDYEDIEEILVAHFEMLGIYEVYPIRHNEIIQDSIFHQLKHNPLIREKVDRMRRIMEDHSELLKRKGASNE